MNTQIYEEACAWFVDFRAGDVDATHRREFDEWIRKSPEHLRAYLEITEIWQDAQFVDGAGAMSVANLIAASARADGNVIALQEALPSRDRVTTKQPPRFLAVAATVLLATLGALSWYAFDYQRGTYGTAVGEQRSISLADGSVVQLNARSKIRVAFSDTGRDVYLISGQALFRVAKDPARPFVVHSNRARVTAVGTQFDVYQRTDSTTVAVIEGKVSVAPMEAASAREDEPVPQARDRQGTAALFLAAGEQVTVTARADLQVEQTSVTNVTAWTRHQLVFRSTPLTQVVEEFNRYNTRRLVIEDARLTDFRIGGVYSSTDPSLLLRFLRDQPGIRITESDDEIVISRTE